MARFTLSVLDQSPIPPGQTAAEALRNSIDLAQLADTLGYRRYWVAEHHATPALACASPEVLIGPIAMATRQLRVGSGGIMLPHYSPLKVAESFSMLASLFPDRIDLGIGRAPGTDAPTAFALQRDRRQAAPDDFPAQLNELLAYLWDLLPADHPFAPLRAISAHPHRPEPWLLGSSPQSGIWAAELGLPYCFADFINPLGTGITTRYRKVFAGSPQLDKPRVAVAAWVVCAETDDEAYQLAAPHRMLMDLLHRGRLVPVPTVEAALQYLAENHLPLHGAPQGRRTIVGSPETVQPALEALAEEYAADEVFVVNIMPDHAARRRCYQLIAETFGLATAARPPADPAQHPGLVTNPI